MCNSPFKNGGVISVRKQSRISLICFASNTHILKLKGFNPFPQTVLNQQRIYSAATSGQSGKQRLKQRGVYLFD